MTEPEPPRDHSGELHSPVPEEPPMPARPEKWFPWVVLAAIAVAGLLAVVVVDTAGGLDGWGRLLYALPAVLFGAALARMAANAAASGRR